MHMQGLAAWQSFSRFMYCNKQVKAKGLAESLCCSGSQARATRGCAGQSLRAQLCC